MGNTETKTIETCISPNQDKIDAESDEFVYFGDDNQDGTSRKSIKEQVISGQNEVPIPPPEIEQTKIENAALDTKHWPTLATIKALDSSLASPRQWKRTRSRPKQSRKGSTILRPLSGVGQYYGHKSRQRNTVIQQPRMSKHTN